MAKKKRLSDAYRYAAGAYRKDKKRRGPLNVELNEFITSVEAEAHILRHTPCSAGVTEVPNPETRTNQHPCSLSADERVLQREAIRNAIDDARLPRRSRRAHDGLTCSDEVVCSGADPLQLLIDAEEAEKRAALVKKAMKSVVKDGTDKAIIRLLYFGSDRINQNEVAKKLGISPSYLSKRLFAIQQALLEFIQREGSLP